MVATRYNVFLDQTKYSTNVSARWYRYCDGATSGMMEQSAQA